MVTNITLNVCKDNLNALHYGTVPLNDDVGISGPDVYNSHVR